MISGARIKEEVSALNRVVGHNSNIKTVFQGGQLQAYCSEDFISLPSIPNNALLTNDDAKVIRGLADHESFHHAYTDLNLWVKAAKYCEASNDSISMRVWNGIEDPRIERLGMRDYTGTKRNLEATVKSWVDDLNTQFESGTNPLAYLPLKMAYMGRVRNGMELELNQNVLDAFNSIELDEFIEPLLEIDDRLELLHGIADFLNNFGLPTLRNFLDGVPVDEQPPIECKFDVSQMHSPDLDSVCEKYDIEYPYYGNEGSVFVYNTSAYNDSSFDPSKFNSIAQQFKCALKTEVAKRANATERGYKLNSKRLVKAYNHAPDIWLNQKGRTRGFDTSIGFVIDSSGSMSSDIQRLAELTGALARAIVSHGIEFEVSSFSGFPDQYKSFDPEQMEMQPDYVVRAEALLIAVAKGYDEPLDMKRIAGLLCEPMGRTPDSEALEKALFRIKNRKKSRKILIILTDGRPEFARTTIKHGGKSYSSREIAIRHRESVLEQAKRDGVEVYCLALRHANVAHFKPSNVVILGSLNSDVVMRTFFQMIAKGEN